LVPFDASPPAALSAPAGAPAAPCRASQLRVDGPGFSFAPGATGGGTGAVVLRNAGSNPCRLTGRPALRLVGGTAPPPRRPRAAAAAPAGARRRPAPVPARGAARRRAAVAPARPGRAAQRRLDELVPARRRRRQAEGHPAADRAARDAPAERRRARRQVQ